jgi:hypothetical protein
MRVTNEPLFESLAQSIAAGSTIKAWATKNHKPYGTARAWSTMPRFKKRVAEIRCELVDRPIGILTSALTEMAEGIVAIARGSQSDQIKLQAWGRLVDDLTKLTGLSELRAALQETRARLDQLQKDGDRGD